MTWTTCEPDSTELLRHHGQFRPVPLLCLSRQTYPVPTAQPQEPTQGIHMGRFLTCFSLCKLAQCAYPEEFESVSKSGIVLNGLSWSRMWESCLSGSERGRSATGAMAEILWHRRESRRQTEKTNFDLQSREAPAYSKNGEENRNGIFGMSQESCGFRGHAGTHERGWV